MLVISVLALLLFCLLRARSIRTISNYGYLLISVLSVVMVGFVLALWFLADNGAATISEGFYSDEAVYTASDTANPFSSARGFWMALNYFLINHDVFGYFSLRLVNIFGCCFFIIYLSSIFKDGKLSLFVLLLCPFLYAMTYVNLRDFFIYTSLLMIVKGIRDKAYIEIAMGVFLILTLRPLMLFVLLAILALLLVLSNVGGTYKEKLKYFVLFVPCAAIGSYFGVEYLDQYLVHMESLQDTDGGEHRTVLASDNSFLISFATFILAPLPTSLLDRLLSEGFTEWGSAHDVLRVINQTTYYAVATLFMLKVGFGLRVGRIYQVLTSFDFHQRAVLLIFFSFAIIYTIHLAGVGHSRLKIPFQVGLAILYYQSFKYPLIHKSRSLSSGVGGQQLPKST